MNNSETIKNNFVPLVSIIIPVYNNGQYLLTCVDSVINQTYKNIEIILIDDGSYDKSDKMCDAYAANDPRIRVIHTKNNGISAARNLGITNSNGEFIFFVDADDSISLNAIDLLMKNYNQTGADVIIGNFGIKNFKTGRVTEGLPLSNSRLSSRWNLIESVRDYLKKPSGLSPLMYCWGKLFKSSIIKNNNIFFNINLSVNEDTEFVFKYLKFINLAFYIKDTIYTYSVYHNFNSAGVKIYNNIFGYRLVLRSAEELLRDSGIENNVIEKEVGSADVFYAIKMMMRLFAPNNNLDGLKTYQLISTIVNDASIHKNLQFYTPTAADSKIIPSLMKFKLTPLIFLVCKYKSCRINKQKE